MTSMKTNTDEGTADREIVISRVFDAPRELIWEVWTNTKHLSNWWGPNGFTTTTHEWDLRPGGVWKRTMHGPDGTDYPNKSIFLEIVKPERIVYSHAGGKKGIPGAHFEGQWLFEAQGDKTKVTIKSIFPSAEDRDRVVKDYGAIEGGKQTLERLAAQVAKNSASKEVFEISREFDAPRDLVWKAWTEREQLMQWFGPKGFTIRVATLDFRPGGTFHYALISADGKEMWGKFVYREIVAPERIVVVNSFSDARGSLTRHPMSSTWPLQMLSTTTFEEKEGKTIVRIHWFPLDATEEEKKTFDSSHEGMKQGWTGTFNQLAEHLAKN